MDPDPGERRRGGRLSLVESRDRAPRAGWIREAIRSLRIHQWVKNGLLFVPIALAHDVRSADRLLDVGLAFAAFCLLASGTYLVNDVLDVEADRKHPSKRNRPIARGSLSARAALLLAATLVGLALAMGVLLLPAGSGPILTLYLVTTLCYSLYLKRLLLLDVIVLAGLYSLRIMTGAVAAGVEVSPWLLAFSSFLFVSLALVKRYVELQQGHRDSTRRETGRAYRPDDIDFLGVMGVVSGYLSVLVLCLFISNEGVSRLYAHPILLWMMPPIMLYWTSRIWLLARRGEVAEDPVVFATRDLESYLCVALLAVAGLLAAE